MCTQLPKWHRAGGGLAAFALSLSILLRVVFKGVGCNQNLSIGALQIQATHLSAGRYLKMYLE